MKKLALFSLFLPLFSHATPAENVLDYASTKDIRDINPHLYSGEMAAQNMVFEGLVKNTEQGIEPWLAESWTVSADGKTYTFKLRQGVKFSDGEPFNAQAAKLNVEAVLANYSRHAWLELVKQLEKVTAIDDYTLELTLKNPYYPTLIELGLTRPFRFISPKAFQNGGTKAGVNGYIGTGAWVLAEHKKNEYAKFERNPHYWGEKPPLAGVKWKVIPDRQTMLLALQKGDVQLIFGADGDMLDMESFQAVSASQQFANQVSEPVASRTLVLNSARPITGDVLVRQALSHAVDKQGIADGIFNGSETVADRLMAKTVPYSDVAVATYDYNLTKANQLLDEAGWLYAKGQKVREKAGKPLAILLSYNINNAAEKEIAELLQADFKKIGVDLQILGEEKQAFLDRQKSGDFDIQYSLSWGKPYDPASFVSSFRIPAHADYQGQKGLPNKAEIDQMISRLLITPSETERQQLYANLYRTLAEQAVYIPLTYSRTKAIFAQSLKNVGFNQSQYEIPFERMWFE